MALIKKLFILFGLIVLCFSCKQKNNNKPIIEMENKAKENGDREHKSILNGQKLFMTLCSSCHEPINSPTRDGFRMEGVLDRLPGGDYFEKFISDSDSLKKSGDSYSNYIDQSYQYDYEHKFKNILNYKEVEELRNYLSTASSR